MRKRATIMRRGFVEWLEHIGSVHQSNKPAVARALQQLADEDQFRPKLTIVDDRTKALSCIVAIGPEFNYNA
jgi:hypothetical protein